MDYYEMLKERGLTKLLREVPFNPPSFSNLDKVCSFLKETINANGNIAVIEDYDFDGCSCGQCFQDAFELLDFKNYKVIPYTKRTHLLDPNAVHYCLQNKFDLVVICDTGSSDLMFVKSLINTGAKVIILDHHNTTFSYEDFGESVAMINTELENKLNNNDALKLSAGALVYCVVDHLLASMGITERDFLSAYGAASLFADCMDMSNDLNRSIYYKAKKIHTVDLPYRIKYFMEDRDRFTSRFVQYKYAPKINAAFRSEHLDLLNTVLLNGSSASTQSDAFKRLIESYEESRKLVSELTDVLMTQVNEYDNFIMCDLRQAEKFVNTRGYPLENYTGYVANRLGSQFGKTAVVLCRTGNIYKGSVRDPYGRKYLHLFQQLCYAGGHGAAFGLEINAYEFNTFMQLFQRLDKYFAFDQVTNTPLIVEWTYNTLDDVTVHDLISVNELSGSTVPKVFLQRKFAGMKLEYSRPKQFSSSGTTYCYTLGKQKFYANHALQFYQDYLFEPIQTGSTYFSLVEGLI